MTLTYEPDPDITKMYSIPKMKSVGHEVSEFRALQTDRQTDVT